LERKNSPVVEPVPAIELLPAIVLVEDPFVDIPGFILVLYEN